LTMATEFDANIGFEFQKILASQWAFLSSPWPVVEKNKYNRTEVKEVNDIGVVKHYVIEHLGVIPVFFFLSVIFSKFETPGPYSNVEKGLLVLYHLLTGCSLAEMARFIPRSSYHAIYRDFFIKNHARLNDMLDQCLSNMFSNERTRVICAKTNNPDGFKHVTLMIDGRDVRASLVSKHDSIKSYSYKLKKSGFRTQVCMDINGMIIFVSDAEHCGTNNDGSMLSKIDLGKFVGTVDVVALDGVYAQYLSGIINNNAGLTLKNFMYPVRKQRNMELDDISKRFNDVFGSFRSMVEDAFSGLSSTFHRFNNRNPIRVSDLSTFTVQLKLASVLYNMKKVVGMGRIEYEELHARWMNPRFDYCNSNAFGPAISLHPDITESLENILANAGEMSDLQTRFLDMTLTTTSSALPMITDGSNEGDNYEVEKVLSHRTVDGVVQFYVKWVGYSDSENSWLERSQFNETECIDEYLQARGTPVNS
jgi:hypothetical protein